MDVPRANVARRRNVRRAFLALIGLAGIASITVYLSRLEPAAPAVDRATVWLDTVKRGPMLREVRGTGSLVPEVIWWIPAATAGRVERISGGQQQRVAVARALVGDPAIMLADEPTGNLDSRNGEAVMELLRDLHRAGATICMVTHDDRYARHADRTVHLFDGRIVDESTE